MQNAECNHTLTSSDLHAILKQMRFHSVTAIPEGEPLAMYADDYNGFDASEGNPYTLAQKKSTECNEIKTSPDDRKGDFCLSFSFL